MKLIYSGIIIITLGAVGILLSVVMEIITGEPVWMLATKIAAGLFGVGGPLVGWGIVKRRRM